MPNAPLALAAGSVGNSRPLSVAFVVAFSTMDHCDQCRFRYGELSLAQVAPTLVQLAGEYDVRLRGGSRLLRAHPIPGTWSAVEYSCHHRDSLRVQLERVRHALLEDCPEFVPMGREERVVAERY